MIQLAEGIAAPAPEDGAPLRYCPEAAQDVTDFISLLCHGQNEWAGKPFALLPWQIEAIRQFYGVQTQDEDGSWARYRRFLYDEIPKKNGKSEFAAALGLYHLLADGERLPNVGIFAADKNNADIIYQAAKYMAEHSCLGQPAHKPIAWARDSRREIHSRFGGVMKVYSADAETKHGYSFSCIIVDELHAQPNRRLWDVLTAGSDAARRQQAVIVLTTAGDDPDRRGIGWEIHEKCRRILAWRQGRPERELDEDDPQWLPIMYGVSVLTGDDPDKIAELDIYDEALWRQCNPSYGTTIRPRQFRAEARAARQSEAAERLFRWLRLNQWIATQSVGWIPLTIYDKTQWGPLAKAERRQWVKQLEGKRCYGGLGPFRHHGPDGSDAAVPAPAGAGYLGGPVPGLATLGRGGPGGAAGPRALAGLAEGRVFGAVPRGHDRLQPSGAGDLPGLPNISARAFGGGSFGAVAAIEAGILRECSVGVAVRRAVCSICGADQGETLCPHIPGRQYEGQTCVMELEGGADAYEASFVAVPAQRQAGVVKSKRYGGETDLWREKARLLLEKQRFEQMDECEKEAEDI